MQTHTAFEKDRKLHFPLLADFESKGRWQNYTAHIMEQQHKPEMKSLSFLVGVWNTSGEIRANGGMPATKIEGKG